MNTKFPIELNVAGLRIAGNVVENGPGGLAEPFDLPAAEPGALTTRGGDSAGTVTLAEAAVRVASGEVDVFWDGGKRLGMTAVLTPPGSVALSGGAGDNLPAGSTPVTLAVPVVGDLSFVGDAATLVAASASRRTVVTFLNATPTKIGDPREITADGLYLWYASSNAVNPFAGSVVATLKLSNADPAASTVNVGALFDPTVLAPSVQ